MSAPLAERPVRELKQLLDTGKLSSQELVKDCLQAISKRDGKIRAFLRLNEEEALAQAKAIDQKRSQGQPLGLLGGLPVGIKDNLCTKGLKTTCSSKILESFVPPYDATVIEKIQAADGVPLGKTNLDEFAMGSSTENSAFGPSSNPWDLERIPGGSSGGSAAAVAGGMVPLSLGSDTGGSIRQPASLCGINGLKPSYGRVSRFGLVAFASSLDQIGPFANDLFGTSLLLQATAGHDSRDSTSLDRPVPDYVGELDQPISGLRLGVAKEFFGAGLDPEVEKAVREALKVYESLGAKIVEVSLPSSAHAIATYYIVATAEASSNLARYDGMHYGHRTAQKGNLIDTYCKSRGEGFGAEVKRRIMLGTYTLSSGYIDAYYNKALKVRRLIHDDFEKAFALCDVVVGPTAPTPAFKKGEKSKDPLAMYLSDIYTISCNLAGIAGLSIPCGLTSQGLPIGLQLQSPPLSESKLLRAARMFENATSWHKKRPNPTPLDQ